MGKLGLYGTGMLPPPPLPPVAHPVPLKGGSGGDAATSASTSSTATLGKASDAEHLQVLACDAR